MIQFKQAVKYESKGRVAIIGPAGGGKSYTSLTLARALAGPDGKIAAVDTEHGSLSKYADDFAFDVTELDTFSPENFMGALDAAEAAHYEVFVVDSLSHFWMGPGGALEFVDLASKRHKDGMGGWKEFRPHERKMVDRMLASPCHIIVTMRTKTDYQEMTDANGKKKRVKIGLAPVQRDGLEYEFDVVGYMDDECNFIVDKSRCFELNGKVIPKPNAAAFAPFITWLAGAKREKPALSEQQRKNFESALETAVDLDVLKSVYSKGYAAAAKVGDAEAIQAFTAAKDKRKLALMPAEIESAKLVRPEAQIA